MQEADGDVGSGSAATDLATRAVLDEDEPGAPESVIVKLPSDDPGCRELGVATGAYEAEVRFFSEIAPLSRIDVPRLHWGSFEPGTGRVTMVLEDLSEDWQVGDATA